MAISLNQKRVIVIVLLEVILCSSLGWLGYSELTNNYSNQTNQTPSTESAHSSTDLNQLPDSNLNSSVRLEPMHFLDLRQFRYYESVEIDENTKLLKRNLPLLETSDSLVYVIIYISDVKEEFVYVKDDATGEVEHVFQVYLPSDEVVNQLSFIPHEHFYVSVLHPSVSMIVDKQYLCEIANNPSVYCISIVPRFCQIC